MCDRRLKFTSKRQAISRLVRMINAICLWVLAIAWCPSRAKYCFVLQKTFLSPSQLSHRSWE